MNNISFLIGLKNNLAYSQKFYENTRLFYPNVEIVFVSYGSSDGTDDWLNSLKDENLKYFYSKESKTLSDTYNKAIEISTKDFVCFLHNDMVLGKNFLNSLYEGLKKHNFICYKTIEPPVFAKDERLWKEVLDFGDSFETFNYNAFYEYEDNIKIKAGEFTENASFFLACQKKILSNIGGLDPLFSPMFCEDDDLILRLKLAGEKVFFWPNAITYHFVSKTSRFSEEFKHKTKMIEDNSQRNFVRKWGFYSFSRSKVKYDVGIILRNGNIKRLSQLEPFANVIYVDFPFEEYVTSEQGLTKYDLNKRIKPISKLENHNVMVFVNGNALKNKTLSLISNLSEIITKNEKKYINPGILNKFYLKVVKPYYPLIFFNQAQGIEKTLIYKDLKTS